MLPNYRTARVYARHTNYLNRDAMHLGDAEGLEDILQVVDSLHPNVFMLSESCVSGAPTIQLANWESVRRIGMERLTDEQRREVIKNLFSRGLEYKKTKYLALNPDLTETEECKFQKKFGLYFQAYYAVKVVICNLINLTRKTPSTGKSRQITTQSS